MPEKVKVVWGKVKAGLKKVPKAVYIALVILLVVAIGVAVFLNTRPYQVLFADLGSTEMSSILRYLDDNGITDYQVDGGTILVPSDQEAGLKARLLMEGYPQSGFAYTYSGTAGTFSTESERAAAELRDLQDRLSAVVRCFDGVKDAVVNIAPGEDHRYVLDTQDVVGAKASVLLTMRDNRKLERKHAEAIRNLVAHSVKGLAINSVEISDTAGNSYSMGDGVTDGEASALKLQLEAMWEDKIRANVLEVLTPYYGPENVKVGVNCTVDVSRTVEDKLDVELPDWANDGSTNGKGIIGSQIYDYVTVEGEDTPAGGTVGTTTNSDLPEYVEDLPEYHNNETLKENHGQIDYENDKTQTHVIRTAGYLTDCSISVSINSTTAGTVNAEEIQHHVARVSGIRGEVDKDTGIENFSGRISVMAMPFYEEPVSILPIAPDSPLQMWMIYVAGGILLLLLIITIVILIVVKSKKKKKRKQQREAERQKAAEAAAAANQEPDLLAALEAQQTDENQDANVMNLRTEKSVELRQDLRSFAEDNPELTAQMIRNWLKGDED